MLLLVCNDLSRGNQLVKMANATIAGEFYLWFLLNVSILCASYCNAF